MPIDLNGNVLSSTSITGSVFNNSIVTDGLVLHLDAGNKNSYIGSGTTWTDLSPQGINGTLNNGVSFSTNNGGSLAFDASNDYVSVGNLGSFSTFTVEIWFKSDSVSNYRNPIDCNFLVFNNGASGYSNIGPRLEQTSAGNLGWVVGDSAGNYSGLDVVPSGLNSSLTHCAVITKPEANRFLGYYNGNITSNLAFSNWAGTMSNINIGRGFSTSSERWFNGKVSIVRIYNRAISNIEILSNYYANKSRFGL